MLFMDFPAFVETLKADAPPPDAEVALRALWYDARDQPESAMRAASFDDNHLCKRVRAYLYRKQGEVHEARLWYWRSGAREWEGSLESEWEDIVKAVLIERPVTNAYT